MRRSSIPPRSGWATNKPESSRARASSARACSRAARRLTTARRDSRPKITGICIARACSASHSQAHGGLGADYRTYALAAAEIGRYCGATALTWNMHVCSTLWSGPLADDLDMDAAIRAEHERRRAMHFRRIVEDGAIYAQPFSEGERRRGGRDRRSAPRRSRSTAAGC